MESVYRLVTGMNETTPLPLNLGTRIIEWVDYRVFDLLMASQFVIPNFKLLNTVEYTANGFDVPWGYVILPGLLMTLGFALPLILIGYFSLQVRELEHK